MIDLHSHILPGVDDGAVDLEMSLAMGRYGEERGITIIAATPHFHEIPDWEKVRELVDRLKAEFAKAQIGVEIVPGAELLMDMALLEMIASDIPTFGNQGKFCLIELPMHQVPIYTEQVIFDLQTKGITPIIAHPERYSAVLADPNLCLGWLKQGCLIQMNSGSLLGRFGTEVKKTAEIMLTHDMVHLVASDAHGVERRRLNLPEAYEALLDIVGQTRAKELVETNPRSILQGNFASRYTPSEYRKKKRFFFF
ncbi:MAG: hypothetical protein GX971_07725 [Firmicutes bacterium]|nr:hypothetical protein [Bacillota bacterium]